MLDSASFKFTNFQFCKTAVFCSTLLEMKPVPLSESLSKVAPHQNATGPPRRPRRCIQGLEENFSFREVIPCPFHIESDILSEVCESKILDR